MGQFLCMVVNETDFEESLPPFPSPSFYLLAHPSIPLDPYAV